MKPVMNQAEKRVLNKLFSTYGSQVLKTLVEGADASLELATDFEKEYWKVAGSTLWNAFVQVEEIESRMSRMEKENQSA